MTATQQPFEPGPIKPRTEPFDDTLIPVEARVLVAVSGGADSMGLLLALLSRHGSCVVAHVNHGLRGAASDGDAQFVLDHSRRLGVPAISRRLQLAASGEGASEDLARQGRYRALREMAEESKCTLVATGHTADDALEGVLLNLLRGSAVEGLAGFPVKRPLCSGCDLIRPLWRTTRMEVRSWCTAAGWQWREDATNGDPRYLRNRVRAEVLPTLARLLEGGNERLARQAARSFALLRSEHDYLRTRAAEELSFITLREEPRLLIIDGLQWTCLHPAMQRRTLRTAAEKLLGRFYRPESARIEDVLHAVSSDARRTVWCWPDSVRVEWTGSMAGNRLRLRVVG